MSRRVDAHWRELAGKLPMQPCGDLQEEVLQAIYDEEALGTGLMLYHRESIELSDPIAQTMDAEAWDRWEKSRKRRWGARCTCSNCGDDFFAGYTRDGKDSGITLLRGEDGQIYEGYTEKGEPEANVYYEGETVICPHCWQSVEVTRRSKLKHGRTHQVMQAETLNVEGYLVVMYWLVSRHQDDTGLDTTHFLPHAALIVDRMGRIRRFRAVRHSAEVQGVTWTPCERSCDPMQQPYYCYGAINGRQVGGWVCEYGPESGGTTGEKTALEEYIGKGGHWPGAYLHVWQKHPQVENLMRGGFSAAVTESIDYELDTCGNCYLLQDAPNIAWVDWSETKPNRMLGMSKEAYRALRGERWGRETAALWGKYRREVKNADALQFMQEVRKIGAQSMERLLGIRNVEPDMTPSRTVRYLEKQKMLKGGVQLLLDYRCVLRALWLADQEEMLWPRDLQTAHDRIMERYAAQNGLESYSAQFTPVYIRLKALEWTDGELCIRIPQQEQDLIDEGKTLRHCVGTYGAQHCGGKPIFFVRHYRRPERSYYTLNIDLTLPRPKEIQLHGYGNEHHGERKQYHHNIPKKVRDFCDRWEREVLTPWFMEEQRKKFAETNKAEKKARKGA